jgi:CDP-diglyceride synthetase
MEVLENAQFCSKCGTKQGVQKEIEHISESTWNAGKIIILIAIISAFIALFLPWETSNRFIERSVNGWGYVTSISFGVKKSGWLGTENVSGAGTEIAIIGISAFLVLLVSGLYDIVKKDLTSKKSIILIILNIIFSSPVFFFLIASLMIPQPEKLHLGIYLFVLSAIAVILGIFCSHICRNRKKLREGG